MNDPTNFALHTFPIVKKTHSHLYGNLNAIYFNLPGIFFPIVKQMHFHLYANLNARYFTLPGIFCNCTSCDILCFRSTGRYKATAASTHYCWFYSAIHMTVLGVRQATITEWKRETNRCRNCWNELKSRGNSSSDHQGFSCYIRSVVRCQEGGCCSHVLCCPKPLE